MIECPLIKISPQVSCIGLLGFLFLAGYLESKSSKNLQTTLFSLSPTEAKVEDDIALQSVVHIPDVKTSKAPSGTQNVHQESILEKASKDEREAEALVAPKKVNANPQKPPLHPTPSQSLYSGVHSSGDPLGSHTGHLGNADGLHALKIGPLHLGASDLAALKSEQEHIADTQIYGLRAELRSLTENRREILNSLTLQRQSSAVKAAHDEAIADRVRLHRAVGTAATRNLRLAMRAASLARKRAIEAKAIVRNELAIEQVERQRAARLEAQRQAAIATASAAEAAAVSRARAQRADRTRRYHTAMRAYTAQLQRYVATDMDLLGRLRDAEDSAAVGPHIEGSGLWRQPAGPTDLPDVDPALFMGDAPLRDADSLASYKAVHGATQLSQTPTGSSVSRALHQERRELRRLDRLQRDAADGTSANRRRKMSRRRREWLPNPIKLSIDVADSSSSAAASPYTSIEQRDSTALPDGTRISAARRPVALVRIPLGAREVRPAARLFIRIASLFLPRSHLKPPLTAGAQDASARAPHRSPTAPRATVEDRSTEAAAVRAG